MTHLVATLAAAAAVLVLACGVPAKTIEGYVADVTNDVCTPLEAQVDNEYVDFACTIAQAGESIVTVLAGTSQIPVTQMTVHVPKAQAPAFEQAHMAATITARKASRGK